MSVVTLVNNSTVGQLASFIGIGACIDIWVLSDLQRRQFASFIFGEHGYTFTQFEKNVISWLVGWFTPELHNRQISAKRVLIYSMATSYAVIFGLIFFSWEHNAGGWVSYVNLIKNLKAGPIFKILEGVITPFWFAFSVSYLSFPGDFFSIWITKRIFVDRRYRTRFLPLLWLMDLLISIAPTATGVVLGVVCTIAAVDDYEKTIEYLALLPVILLASTTVSSLLISALQLLLITSGTLLRLLLAQAPRLRKIAETRSLIRQNPATLCLLFLGCFLTLINYAYSLVRPG